MEIFVDFMLVSGYEPATLRRALTGV